MGGSGLSSPIHTSDDEEVKMVKRSRAARLSGTGPHHDIPDRFVAGVNDNDSSRGTEDNSADECSHSADGFSDPAASMPEVPATSLTSSPCSHVSEAGKILKRPMARPACTNLKRSKRSSKSEVAGEAASGDDAEVQASNL